MRTRIGTVVLLVALGGLLWAAPSQAASLGLATVPLDGGQAKTAECTLGDVVADAARACVTDAEVALLPAGHLRTEAIPAGELLEDRLAGALLFPEESVVVIELTGAQLKETLERSLSFVPRPSTSLLQVSGVSVSYRSSAAPGQRVTDVQVGGAPLAPERTYRVAMPASLAKGAMGYYRVFGTREAKQVGPTLRVALAKHVQTVGTISLTAGQRLKDLSPPVAK